MSKTNMEIEIYTQSPDKKYAGKVFSGRFGGKSTAVLGLACNFHGIQFTAHIWARTVVDKNTQQESVEIAANPPSDITFDSPALLLEFQKHALSVAKVNLGYNAAVEKALLRLSTEAKPETTATASRDTLDLTAFKAAIAKRESEAAKLETVPLPTSEVSAAPVDAAGPKSGIAPETETAE